MLKEIITSSEEETRALAYKIGQIVKSGDLITLDGDLGAGKTTFTQGLGLGLGIKDKINSPTFNILKCYFDGRLSLFHIDAYRLEDKVNDDIGLEEVIQGEGVAVVEWSIFIEEMIYQPLKITIEYLEENKRKLTFSSTCDKYKDIFNLLEAM